MEKTEAAEVSPIVVNGLSVDTGTSYDHGDAGKGDVPYHILDIICANISSFHDLISISMINKHTYQYVMNNSKIWKEFLSKIGMWSNAKSIISISDIDQLNALNCLNKPINDTDLAMAVFKKIYSVMSPIVKQMLVDNYSNFQNLAIFSKYRTPVSQAKLFTNIGNFLQLYDHYGNYESLIIRYNTILNLFVNSLVSEIDVQLKEKNFSMVLNLITALDYLNISNDQVSLDPLETLFEFFIGKYNEDYSFLLQDDISTQCFIEEDENTTKRGVVKGFSLDYDKIDDIFAEVSTTLNKQLADISAIFHPAEVEDKNVTVGNRNIDEIPIILKLLENFLGNHLIGGLIDRIILKAKHIDALDEVRISKAKLKTAMVGVNDDAHDDDDIHGSNDELHDPKTLDEHSSYNSHINIMNEDSLFFQCVPYIHSKLIAMLQGLQYPHTEIVMDSGEKTQMDYVKVTCEFINFYYEQYLIEFSTELPRKCHISLIHLINAWQTNNQKTQKNVESEIMKLVDDDYDENKRSNFEIFTTFTNLFTFKKSEKRQQDSQNSNDKESENDDDKEDQSKLTKMAAKLRILVGKVESLKTLVSIDLTVLLLQHIKNSYDLLLGLTKYSITEQLKKQINQTCTNIFNDMLTILVNNHIKPGFSEALERLKSYKPINMHNGNEGTDFEVNKEDGTIEPVNNFIELVDVGDLILQMINVFYNHELIQSGILPSRNLFSRDFLRMNSIEKSIKLLESTLDTYVANGLDISIDIIVSEIRFKVEECVGPIPVNEKSINNVNTNNSMRLSDSMRSKSKPPQSSSSMATQISMSATIYSNIESSTVYNIANMESLPLNEGLKSKWCEICLDVLNSHFSLLQDSIDKSIMDVFKQELGDRLITFLIQLLMKKFKISIIGGVQFSFDINALYSYYQRNRIKPAIEYLIGFKKIDQLYLVDCSSKSKEFKSQCKELAKLVVDIGRENGVFTPEEVYQFVSRRADWDRIKKNVDKVVYGMGADDCVIM
jgi:recyclin-1